MQNSIYLIGPIFIPFIGAILALLFTGKHYRLQRYLACLAGSFALLCSAIALVENASHGAQVYRMGNWIPPYGIVLVADGLSSLFVFMASAVMMGGILYIFHFKDECGRYFSFVPLFLLMETGINGAFYTGDMFTFFVFIELTVLSSVSLTAMSDDRFGLEAAIKYIFISGVGSLFLLMGIAAMYATLGTLNLAHMAQLLSGMPEQPLLVGAASVMLMCAFLLKSAVFPFHFWQPDFHTTAPTPVSAMLSSIVVKVGIYGIIRMVTLLFVDGRVIQDWLIILGIVGIFFGGLGALRTYNGKRMLAYSTLSQIGFILIGIGWGTHLALVAAIVYAFNHAFIKSSLLMLTGVVASWTENKTARMAQLEGVGAQLPQAVGLLYLFGGLALSGIPPLNGFISKLLFVQSGVAAGEWLWLGLAASGSIFTLMYTTRAWQLIFQRQPGKNSAAMKAYGDSWLAPAILIAACLFLGLYALPLIDFADQAVEQILRPEMYVNVVRLFEG